MRPTLAKLFSLPNARPDLGQVHGVNIRTGERRMARQAVLEPVERAAPPLPPMALVSVSIYPATFMAHDRIIKTVCHVFGVRLNEVLSERRNAQATEARQVAMALCVRLTKLSMPRIGFIFDRDHTTVLHASRKMQPHIDAIEAHMPPDSIMEWVTSLKERLITPEVIEARRVKYHTGDRAHITECLRGHPYNEENTGWRPDGKRFCITCTRRRSRLRYQANKAARLAK